MKIHHILALVMFLSVASALAAPAVNKNTGKTFDSGEVAVESSSTPEQKLTGLKRAGRPGYAMLSGSVSKIDATDPSKIMIEVKGEPGGELHTIEIAPTTSVTKVTDISELKEGDSIRVMAKKIDDKEVAVGVMFGNLKKPSAQKE